MRQKVQLTMSEKEKNDRLDSGMTETERGTPYSIQEAKMATRDLRLDSYYQGVMEFLIRRIERLEKEARKS